MAHSLGVDRDVDLRDDYDDVQAGSNIAGKKAAGKRLDRHVRRIEDAEVFAHPLGLPFLAAPLIAVNQRINPGSAPDALLGALTLVVTFAGLVLFWRLLCTVTETMRDAALITLCVYFGSPLWFYSRTFFTEPFTWSFAVFSVVCIVSNRMILASFFLGLTIAMKETALLLVFAIVFGCIRELGIRKSAVLAIGPLFFALLFAGKNYLLVGTPFSTFQTFTVGDPVGGAAGLIFDPAHGLLWFAPLLAIGSTGWLRGGRIPNSLRISAAIAFFSYFALTAAWVDWRGGSSYATRLLLPALPALAVPLVAFFYSLRGTKPLFFGLFLSGFIVNFCAATDPFTAFWGEPAHGLVGKNISMAVAAAFIGALLYHVVATKFPENIPEIRAENS
ncbi:MAG TPA: hypothetical protein VM557_07170 [Thermoanaerobaculia bacterium]|nr:hypothetical protein [Thermoanaerobaculia bacterium]